MSWIQTQVSSNYNTIDLIIIVFCSDYVIWIQTQVSSNYTTIDLIIIVFCSDYVSWIQTQVSSNGGGTLCISWEQDLL